MSEQDRVTRVEDISRGSGSHAMVIGGSIAGLTAARVLTNHFDRVTLIERDHYPEGADPRVGVPQSRHIHVLLLRGQRELERLFPGLDEELGQAGAEGMDWGRDWRWLGSGGWSPQYVSGLHTRLCSRPLLEVTIRRRVAAHPKISILQDYEVTNLLPNADGSRIEGVHLRPNAKKDAAGVEQTLRADLVVDASGRGSKSSEWLQGLGYPMVDKTIINSFLGYATRWLKRPANFKSSWKVLLVGSLPPVTTRTGLIYPVEGDRWVVGLMGESRDYPPTDEAAWIDFAKSLRSPVLYEAIKNAEPLTPVYGFRRTENRIYHYDRLSRWPENFVVTGDAVCAFNPFYGQGISVATMGSVTLDESLAEHRRRRPSGDMTGLSSFFQKRLAKVAEEVWVMATGQDFRWPTTEGGRPNPMVRFLHTYMDHVQTVAAESSDIHKKLLEVVGLVRSPTSLFHPSIMARVMRQAIKNGGAVPPAQLSGIPGPEVASGAGQSV